MLNNNSAELRDGTPHANNSISNKPFSESVRRRAQSLIENTTIDDCARAFIQYTLENDDPYLTKLVRRVAAGESILTMSPHSKTNSTPTRKRRKTT
jgi:hypothetical protein